MTSNRACRSRVAWPALARMLGVALGVGGTVAPSPALPSESSPVLEEPAAGGEALPAATDRFPLEVNTTRARPAVPDTGPPSTPVEVKPGLTYLRIRSIMRDLPAVQPIVSEPAVILDLRFVRAGVAESLALGGLLAQNELQLALGGDPASELISIAPAQTGARRGLVLALVNRSTAGPIEAVLDALQEAGDILIVGENTKGDTGRVKTAAGTPDRRVNDDGDYRRAGGSSLLGRGVTPGLAVSVTPSDDEKAYRAFDAGATIAALLDTEVEKDRYDEARLLLQHGQSNGRRAAPPSQPASSSGEAAGASSRPATETAAPTTPSRDRILHRAVNTVIALRALRRFSDS